MHRESTKKLKFKETQVGKDFTSEKLTSYSGLTVINDYVNHLGLFKALDKVFLQTIDCDSTEQTVFGHQEGASKGYNPKNKGKLSYHPLICFLSEMKIALNSW